MRRGIINDKEIRYDLDWHNKCFYINYIKVLKNKKVIVYTSDYYCKWIMQVIEKIPGCICKETIPDINIKHNNVEKEEYDYIVLATEKWWEIKQYLLKKGLDSDKIIYAFFCRQPK